MQAFILLAGCSISSSSEGSYAGILVVNETEYYWQGDIGNEFTVGDKIGEVQKKVEINDMPQENLSSNFLDLGEEIYMSNEDDRVIIVKRRTGILEKMTREDYYTDK
ncbi:hypothetical protein JOC85_001868 [Bacillus mesophilus]|uniref:Uncharacterized protein n=1 Tax=Bacillus mesophilus TaxID=1808955 RepID=A0A6M0Q4W5_9BACI|nr:hypothetical protein [Bacillus mesophilus]MBM7661096.1 hypothetical protein [Bacillus mesophilus]NEY71371.1 hypothetical protein [Bacillus mesophilus]